MSVCLFALTHLKHAGHDESLIGSAHHDPDVKAHDDRLSFDNPSFYHCSLMFLSEQMFGLGCRVGTEGQYP